MKKMLLIIGIMIILSVQTVSAQEEKVSLQAKEGVSEKGSIQIIIPEEIENTKREGIGFQCIKVADIVNGKYVFRTEIVQEHRIDLKEEMTADESNEIAEILAQSDYADEVKITDRNGMIKFDDLEKGLYLLKVQSVSMDGRISSALIAVPTWDDIQKKMEYNIEVIPKYVQGEKTGVKTGDSKELKVYYVAMSISLLFMLCLIRRRKNNEG